MLGGRPISGCAIAYLYHGQSSYTEGNQIRPELLPFFRSPGVVNADIVGVELDMVFTILSTE